MCKESSTFPRVDTADMYWSDKAWDSKPLSRRSGDDTDIATSMPVIPVGMKEIEFEEVGKHCSSNDNWLIIGDGVYDCTEFAAKHPGGAMTITNLAGKDATDVFYAFHPEAVVKKWLPRMLIGRVVNKPAPTPAQQGFRRIRQHLVDAGYFKISQSYYASKCGAIFSILALSVFVTAVLQWPVVGGLLMGTFWQQLAFLGHDAGHNSVSHNRDQDYLFGLLVGPLFGGISINWWKATHNVHHVSTNSIEHDPDIQHLPVIAVHERYFTSVYSKYHKRIMPFDAAARFFVTYQHYLYFPIMMVARWNLYLQSAIFLATQPNLKYRVADAVCMGVFFAWLFSLLQLLPSTSDALLFLFTAKAVAGILHVQITISHFSRACYGGMGYNDESSDFLKTQLATSMNVDCPRYMDWFHGGLQFQIEHHLFPRLPRHNLRVARDLLKKLSGTHRLDYHEASWFQCISETIGTLKMAAEAAVCDDFAGKKHRPTNTLLWDAMNAEG